MTDRLRAAAQAALEALEYLESQPHVRGEDDCYEDLIAEIRAALAEPEVEQRPAAWIERGLIEAPDTLVWERGSIGHYTPLYTRPPRREWVGLTERERLDIRTEWNCRPQRSYADLMDMTAAALKEKNA